MADAELRIGDVSVLSNVRDRSDEKRSEKQTTNNLQMAPQKHIQDGQVGSHALKVCMQPMYMTHIEFSIENRRAI
jgi:hypothetical protein